MSEDRYAVYGYRWVVLAVFVFINITIQILWITFASITLPASQYYQVSDLQIGLLAMIFMIVYIPLSLPVSWMIDTWGFYRTVSLGGDPDVGFRPAARRAGRELHCGSAVHHRDCHLAAIYDERLDESGGALVPYPGAGYRGRPGGGGQLPGHGHRAGADAIVDRPISHSDGLADLWGRGDDFRGVVYQPGA